MHKRIIALGLSAVITASAIPSNLIEVSAAEINKAQVEDVLTTEEDQDLVKENQEEKSSEQQKDVEENEKIEVQSSSNQRTIHEKMTRTLTLNANIEGQQYGRIEGLDDGGKVTLNSEYENVDESTSGIVIKTTTYTGTLVSSDEEKQIVIKPKEGYEFDTLKYTALLTQASTTAKDFMSVEKDGDVVTITLKPITSERWTKVGGVDNTNKNITINIGLSKKVLSQKITTEVEGEGTITTDEDLVYEDGAYVISRGSTHTFNLEPAQGMEVKSATLDGEPVAIENNQVTVGKGHLKVVFGKVAVKHNLNINITGEGSVFIANQNITSTKDILINEGESYEFSLTPGEGYYVKSVKLDGVEINPYKIENIEKDSNLEVVFAEIMETTIEVGDLKVPYDGNEKTLSYKVIDSEGNVVEENNVVFKKKILGIPTKFNPVEVGTYDFEIQYKGDDTHKPTEFTGTFEITKCNPKVSVKNKQVTYDGNAVGLDVTVTPDCGYITVYTGVNVKLSPKIYVDLNLGNDIASTTLKKLLGNAQIANVGELVELLKKSETILGAVGIDISQIIKVLEVIPSGTSIAFGCPNQPGTYLGTAVVMDSNANTAIGMGTLLIKRANKEVLFTDDSLENGATIKVGQDYKHEAYYEGTTSQTKIMYVGVSNKIIPYFSSKKPTKVGKYTAVAYSFTDLNYKTALAKRTFTIEK